jgi:hypothetical protein
MNYELYSGRFVPPAGMFKSRSPQMNRLGIVFHQGTPDASLIAAGDRSLRTGHELCFHARHVIGKLRALPALLDIEVPAWRP